MTQISGKTQHALAQLLNDYATHSVIESLFLRFDLDSLVSEANPNPNKLTKATFLAKELAGRNDSSFQELVDYIYSSSSRMNHDFSRESNEAKELLSSLEADVSSRTAQVTGASGPSSAGRPSSRNAERQFQRPGTTAPPSPAATQHADTTKRYVFVVRGRDHEAYKALEQLLTALDLRIITWDDATRGTSGGTPHTLDIVRAGIEMSDAVVVLMTPDDLGRVKPEFGQPTDDPREGQETGQVRQNVVFEAGWAMALNQEGVVLVRVGAVRNLSDIEGLNYVNLTNDISGRRTLISRLKNCGLAVDDAGENWRSAGSFPES
ncbi:TIR domain-containing protein [Arthrobacter sp. TS-15]|uniref:TIR domain-containing protein n=1 Tax=Arthrobacter sp. TS-15 TaxID=2510797 RepID=UPI00135CD9D0|nr:nucleotide-binding protein [Arthrobacter sp. TS-15]